MIARCQFTPPLALDTNAIAVTDLLLSQMRYVSFKAEDLIYVPCSPVVVQVNPNDTLEYLVSYRRSLITLQLSDLTVVTQELLICTSGLQTNVNQSSLHS